MKKLLYILIAILFCACEHAGVSPGGGSTANTKKICRGYGYEVVYTVRGDKVCNGYGYNVAYTIRGNQICDGYGYSVAYTIHGCLYHPVKPTNDNSKQALAVTGPPKLQNLGGFCPT